MSFVSHGEAHVIGMVRLMGVCSCVRLMHTKEIPVKIRLEVKVYSWKSHSYD